MGGAQNVVGVVIKVKEEVLDVYYYHLSRWTKKILWTIVRRCSVPQSPQRVDLERMTLGTRSLCWILCTNTDHGRGREKNINLLF